MHSLEDIFAEAVRCCLSNPSDTDLERGMVIRLGVKIDRIKDTIKIINTSRGGSYYQECSVDEYALFHEYGWEQGCVHLALENCIHKLGLIEGRIKLEVNTRKNDKHIKNLKRKRDEVLLKYASYKLKLN
tara:strand:- start:253 stop:642 length:390 start_codon:yes stop_codon:yes gene_type:complete